VAKGSGQVGSVIAKLALLGIAMLCSIAIAEGVLRLALDEVDFLQPVLVDDPVLGHRVVAGSAGHDRLGLRNKTVPERVDILAIGDSQTYGVSAMAMHAWPVWLASESGRETYNMALGGWGAIQYEHMLREHGLAMQPEIVVVGLYLGNDVLDAYQIVYGLDRWRALRAQGAGVDEYTRKSVEGDLGESDYRRVQRWLARHTILYRLAVSAFGQALGRAEVALRGVPEGVVRIDEPGLSTGFTPGLRLQTVDLRIPEIREGLRLTLDALDRIEALCEANGSRLVVLYVPTKESVFAERLAAQTDAPEAEAIAALLEYEARIRDRVAAHLEARGVTFLDPRPAMRAASEAGPIYPSNEGGHPISAGYHAIAKAVAEAL